MQGRRLWITGPYEVSAQPFDLPDTPDAGKVLVQTERTLISAGTELAIVMGTHIGFTTGAAWPRYPMALGYTAVCRVASVGEGVSGLSPGDRVLAGTPHASHAHVEASSLLPVPAGCSPEAALLAYLASIPMGGIRLAGPRMGEGMAVFGQGLIGALAARIGRIAGCRPVLGIDPIAERRELAAAAGIVPVDPTDTDVAEAHRSRAEGRLPEIVIEATGAPPVIGDALKLAADLGRVVLMGSPRGRVEIDPYSDIHRKGISVIGAHARWAPGVESPFSPFTTDRNRRYLLSLVADGTLAVEPLLSHHIAPEAAADTYRALARRAPGYMGVVLDWSR